MRNRFIRYFLSRCWWWFNNKYSFHCYTDHSSSFSSQDYQFWSRVVLMISEEHQQYNDGLNVTIFPWDGSVQRCHHTMVSWSSGKLRWNSSNIIQILTINNKALKLCSAWGNVCLNWADRDCNSLISWLLKIISFQASKQPDTHCKELKSLY